MKYGLTLWVAFFIGSQAFGQEMLNKIRNESARTIRRMPTLLIGVGKEAVYLTQTYLRVHLVTGQQGAIIFHCL